MESKTISQICEELAVLNISPSIFNQAYIRLQYAIIGALRMKDYQSKKDVLDLGYALINAHVVCNTNKEFNEIESRKIGIIYALTDLQARSR